MHLQWLVFVSSLLCFGVCTGAETCSHPREANPLGTQIAKVASHEYDEFNGHRINANGYLWKFGSVESASELLYDPETGLKDENRPGRFAWRRVWQYWLTLDKHVEGEALSRKVILVPGLLENPSTTEKFKE